LVVCYRKTGSHFIPDYFVNLYEQSHASSDEAPKEAGVLLRTDFIDFAARLEGCAHDFFNKDLMKLKLRGDRGRHKYPRERTRRTWQN
jgi:hypothetical protein